MSAEKIDWDRLARLRKRFLEIEEDPGVYWDSAEDLAHYHRFFGQRIGWKWRDALRQAKQAGWHLRSNRVVDWGCGIDIDTCAASKQKHVSNAQNFTEKRQ